MLVTHKAVRLLKKEKSDTAIFRNSQPKVEEPRPWKTFRRNLGIESWMGSASGQLARIFEVLGIINLMLEF